MENENTNEKKKQKVAALIGLVTLLLAVLGATYAFFQIDTNTESSNITITGSTPPKSLVTLKGITSNLHLNISASDMSLDNVNNEYYATDVEGKAYEDNEEDGTKTIANVKLSGGEATTEYSCTAKLTVSRVTVPEEADKDMIEVLKPGDIFLQFKGNIISNILDISMLKETGKIEYNLKFKVTENTPEEIQAYIKLINKNESQNYLAGSKLNIDINTSDLKCEVFIPDPKIAQLKAKDKEVSKGVEHLSTDLQGGMYRYQGTDDVPNWICFGTTDKNQCTDETDSDSNNIPDGIDKYMYRILGITEYGEMYLIKETFLKEKSGITEFAWNDKYYVDSSKQDYCDNGLCPEWNTSLLFKRINGISNGKTSGSGYPTGDTNIFVNSSEYDYLKSGDNDGVFGSDTASDWYNLIADHEWMYGDIGESSTTNKYNGDAMYEIEQGNKETFNFVGTKGNITKETYTWSKKVTAKISLMYVHDYYYGYYDGSSEDSRGNAGSYSKIKDSWLFFQKDGYNTSTNREWLSSRFGVREVDCPYVFAWYILNGEWGHWDIYRALGVRPVFYLSSNSKIADGDGTKANPYILDVQDLAPDSFD